MPLRTTLSALLLALFLAVPSPAEAKGPTQVEVRNLSTGTTTVLIWEQKELSALMELVEWPASRRKPSLVATGALTHVATLDWQFDDGQGVWLDRVFSDGDGTTWIARRDHLLGNTFVTWGQVRAPVALDLLLARLEGAPADATTPARSAAPTTEARASQGGFEIGSFGWGAAAAALLGGAVSLVLRQRRSRLV